MVKEIIETVKEIMKNRKQFLKDVYSVKTWFDDYVKNGNLVPPKDDNYDLGSKDRQWRKIYGGTLPKTVNQATVTLGDTETLTLWRAILPAGKQIKVIEAGIQPSGTTDLTIEVYNQTDAATIYSSNASYDDGRYGTPLASGGTGDDVEIRLNNDSGAIQDASGWVTFVVE